MDKNNFINLLGHFAETSEDEARQLAALRKAYPYSQVLHALCARVSKDHSFETHQSDLALAAVYSADRSVLKEVMLYRPTTPDNTVVSKSEFRVLQQDTPAESTRVSPIPSVEGIDYADEVMRDLETLNTLKNNFEMLLVEYSEVVVSIPATTQDVTKKNTTEPKQGGQKKEKGKSKRQRIIELAKAQGLSKKDATAETKPASKKAKASHTDTDEPDVFIEEIKSNKQELKPNSRKQKEQIDIIDQFIKIQPSISSAKDRNAPPSGDLNPIKSGEFGDNIVSETLVEILMKQGKKDKAIEVLKKLIWKYPQKKTYFASQIEDLKK